MLLIYALPYYIGPSILSDPVVLQNVQSFVCFLRKRVFCAMLLSAVREQGIPQAERLLSLSGLPTSFVSQ